MTFYEAAVEVLREAGRPLHYKKITEISIERSLLSHVGKTPEITMGARLLQEVKKGDDQSLIAAVRPGVYSLVDGADPQSAKETIRLREAPEVEDDELDPEAEDEDDATDTVGDDADDADDDSDDDTSDDSDEDDDDDSDDDDASASDDKNGSGRNSRRRRRRRRGRRGGRGRSRNDDDESSDDDDANDDAQAASDDDAKTEAKPKSKPAPKSDDAPAKRSKPARPAIAAAPAKTDDAEDIDGGSDLANAIAQILGASKRGSMSLKALAEAVAERQVGSLGRVGTAMLRAELVHTNRRRASVGRPPLFDEMRPNHWALASASGNALARSYGDLDRWQSRHRSLLKLALIKRLGGLDDEAFGSVITLLLDRMGYRELERHERIGEELTTVSALAPRGLTTTRLAVRVIPNDVTLSREHVIALRGSLHTYRAAEGALVAMGGVDPSAHTEVDVPNLAPITLIGASELAEHLVGNGVGVNSFSVDVSCLDEGLFRDLDRG